MKIFRRLSNQQAKVAAYGRNLHLRLQGVNVHPSCWIDKQVEVNLGFVNGLLGNIQLAEQVKLQQGAILNAWGGKIVVCENVFLGPYTVIYGHGGVVIGKDSLISMHCRILSSNHSVPDCSRHIRWEPDIPRPTTIGEDVWLGAGVTVVGGVTIGNGCVVGAGAVVTQDLPPYSIAVGVPARVIKMRPCSKQSTLQESKNTAQCL